MDRKVSIPPCEQYRYRLARAWDAARPGIVFCMLNPSTADAQSDDPTIRRVVAFARAWGCGRVDVINLLAFRCTDPRGLRRAADACGPENLAAVRGVATRAPRVVCAWGRAGSRLAIADAARHAIGEVARGRLLALRINRDGSPAHPLYVRGDATPVPYCLPD